MQTETFSELQKSNSLGHLPQEAPPHRELFPILCGHLLALKGQGRATAIYLLSLGPGRQVALCAVTNYLSSSYSTPVSTLTPIQPQEIQWVPGAQWL